MNMQALVPNVPGFSRLIHQCASVAFPGSKKYWERRYARGRNSGDGSYGRLAEFKAEIVNQFVRSENIESVIEFGFGDGNQLEIAEYPNYIGLDVSATAADLCQRRFASDLTKSFFVYDPPTFHDHSRIFRAELALSLDVVYHLIEDRVFEKYMTDLFRASDRYVIVYSSNEDALPASPHVRHRNFTQWIENRLPQWRLQRHIPNRYPFDPQSAHNTSFADFFVFEKSDSESTLHAITT